MMASDVLTNDLKAEEVCREVYNLLRSTDPSEQKRGREFLREKLKSTLYRTVHLLLVAAEAHLNAPQPDPQYALECVKDVLKQRKSGRVPPPLWRLQGSAEFILGMFHAAKVSFSNARNVAGLSDAYAGRIRLANTLSQHKCKLGLDQKLALPSDRLCEFAEAAFSKANCYAFAAMLYIRAFVSDQPLKLDLKHRFLGARATALASQKAGVDSRILNSEQREHFRAEGCSWFARELQRWKALSKKAFCIESASIQKWISCKDFEAFQNWDTLRGEAQLLLKSRSAA
jgi:hypothetical protein